MVTLALNVAGPLVAGEYGKTAFDAVGPLLLIHCAKSAACGLPTDHTTIIDTCWLVGQVRIRYSCVDRGQEVPDVDQ